MKCEIWENKSIDILNLRQFQQILESLKIEEEERFDSVSEDLTERGKIRDVFRTHSGS